MPHDVPAWLAAKFEKPGPGHARLAVASLGSAELLGKGGFSVSSPAFTDRGALDPCFTADEEDAVAPPLEWTAPPPGSQELVLVVEDPDAPAPEPFVHWLVWGLKPQNGQLLEGDERVGHDHHRGIEAVGQLLWRLHQDRRGAGPHRVDDVAVAVGPLPAQRDEEGAGRDATRVDGGVAEGGDRGRSRELATDGGQQVVEANGRRHGDHAADYRRV